jgi:integrase
MRAPVNNTMNDAHAPQPARHATLDPLLQTLPQGAVSYPTPSVTAPKPDPSPRPKPPRFTSYTLRYSFATHLLGDGYDIRTIQEWIGDKDVKTTMIYTHVVNRGGKGVRSPVDAL